MNTKHAKRLMLDVMGIVLSWNESFLTDKQAMDKVVGSLLKDKHNQNGYPRTKTTKKSASIIAMISGLCVFLFVFVSFGDFTNAESMLQMENEKLIFEQLDESSSETKGKILNNTKEEFSNQISLRLD